MHVHPCGLACLACSEHVPTLVAKNLLGVSSLTFSGLGHFNDRVLCVPAGCWRTNTHSGTLQMRHALLIHSLPVLLYVSQARIFWFSSMSLSLALSLFCLSEQASERERRGEGALSKVVCFCTARRHLKSCAKLTTSMSGRTRTSARTGIRTHAHARNLHTFAHILVLGPLPSRPHAHEHAQLSEANRHRGSAQHRLSRARSQAPARTRARFEMKPENWQIPDLLARLLFSLPQPSTPCLNSYSGSAPPTLEAASRLPIALCRHRPGSERLLDQIQHSDTWCVME